MATDPDLITVVTQYKDRIYLGGTQTLPATAVGILTYPHGVYLEFRIPQTSYNAQAVSDYKVGFNDTAEAMFTIPGVTDMSWAENPRPSGQVIDEYTLYLETPSGASTGELVIPSGDLAVSIAGPKVAAIIAALQAAEGTVAVS
jgi:hypothetical protein